VKYSGICQEYDNVGSYYVKHMIAIVYYTAYTKMVCRQRQQRVRNPLGVLVNETFQN